MHSLAEIHVDLITSEYAVTLNRLLVSNRTYFQKYMPVTIAGNLTVEDSLSFIKNVSEDALLKKQFLFVIKLEAELVGLIYLKELDWEKKQGELAYCVAEKLSGKGIISNAVKQLTKIAFNDLNLKNLSIITHKTNIGSIKVAEKCGFQHSKTLKNEFTPTGENSLNMELYQLRK